MENMSTALKLTNCTSTILPFYSSLNNRKRITEQRKSRIPLKKPKKNTNPQISSVCVEDRGMSNLASKMGQKWKPLFFWKPLKRNYVFGTNGHIWLGVDVCGRGQKAGKFCVFTSLRLMYCNIWCWVKYKLCRWNCAPTVMESDDSVSPVNNRSKKMTQTSSHNVLAYSMLPLSKVLIVQVKLRTNCHGVRWQCIAGE